MNDIAQLFGPTIKNYLEFRGSLLSLGFLFLCAWLPVASRNRVHALVGWRFDTIAVFLMALFVAASVIYLAFPGYFDHMEPSVALLGGAMVRGEALYPVAEVFPYHGTVYGPALAHVQMASNHFGLSIIAASKLPGVVAFMAALLLLLLATNRSMISRGYLLLLLPFGAILFWNRAEPFLLLLVCVAIFLGLRKPDGKTLPIMFGVLAGVASALKIHGAIYVFAAWLAISLGTGVSVAALLCFGVGAVAAFFVFFLPQHVSFAGLLSALMNARDQGLSPAMAAQSFAFLVFMNAPVVMLWRGGRLDRRDTVILVLVLALETLVAVLASKPGAGPHHLLPFIPVNALIVQYLHAARPEMNVYLIRVLYASVVCHALLVFAGTLAKPMAVGWQAMAQARAEVAHFDSAYPGLVMGVTDQGGYAYTFFRPLLSARQIDYATFMDLQYTGTGDGEFLERLHACTIPALLMINTGAPFSLGNAYTDRPLFSDDLRTAFAEHYVLAESQRYFSAWTCVPHS